MPPMYEYLNEETGESKLVMQGMNDLHEYSEGKVKWKRVFLSCQASFDTIALDPFKASDFTKKTGDLKSGGKMSDLYDRARDLSEKRKQIAGHDPVKEKFTKDYSKRRAGKKLPMRNANQYYGERE